MSKAVTISQLRSTVEQASAEIRWVPLSSMQAHRRKLQQRWVVVTYENGRAIGQHNEWRDVPLVAEATP